MGKSIRIGISIPAKLLNHILAAYSSRNFGFLILHTEYFHKTIIFPFLVLTTFEVLLFAFFLSFE